MAEDADKKEEEKFEFDAAGQSLGYISLDQARVLAMEHARDNRDFYGRRYASRELVWEVLSQEESEDYYDIRLSYRPARGFQDEPGVDQFTIDKLGPIPGRRHTGLGAAYGVAGGASDRRALGARKRPMVREASLALSAERIPPSCQ